MSSNKKQSGFSVWYNSPAGQRLVGAVYSLGAAVVIIGALFKIMHWPFAGILLSAGMITEAILFAIGVFEKPHKTYEWDKVFAFDGKGGVITETVVGSTVIEDNPTMRAPQALADAEVVSLSEGIKNLSETAKQLSTVSSSINSAKDFAKNIESASEVTANFVTTQESLNKVTGKLFSSYDSLNNDMNSIVDGTTQYAEKVGNINKNLSSLNAVYEIQLKNIQAQSEVIASHTENTRLMAQGIDELIAENQKIKQSTQLTVEEINKYKEASTHLANQISELNKIYGNMLNALN